MFKNSRASRATKTADADLTTSSPGSEIKLRSLAPDYDEDQHATYVHHLEAALAEPRNKNIALTGPYGSGKSSVLNRFLGNLEEQRRLQESTQRDEAKWWQRLRRFRKPQSQRRTLSISISTLGSDKNDPEITNRIQKELVKQLLYRVEPGTVKRSSFARKPEPGKWQFWREAVGFAAALVGVLWLFGARPDISPQGADLPWWLSLASMFVLAAGSAWALRWSIGNRPITQVAAGGTAISFDKETDSVFDKYLDEIVEFFDASGIDVVVFEDLDRFEDPQIFDSLRELNTLINASASWMKREEPLRFIYAIKDSLFEKLAEESPKSTNSADENGKSDDKTEEPANSDTSNAPHDDAKAEVERANRTKFFEIVIPVVPFLSHSNARDLLNDEMDGLALPGDEKVSRPLINIVARNATDMRLLINIRNEFVVFAQKLLWVESRAPEITADDLFALVAYKNLHLADFETLPHRESALDKLERKRRDVVSASIEKLQKIKSEDLDLDLLRSAQEETAQMLGDRLEEWTSTMGQTITGLTVAGRTRTLDEIRAIGFWEHVSEAGEMELHLRSTHSNQPSNRTIKIDQLKTFFPEAMVPHQWDGRDDELAVKRAESDRRVAELRGADFATLAKLPRVEGVEESFAEAVNKLVPSRLAGELVLEGHLTRYFAEHSSVFYGSFVGVDVANFFRNCVWPNEMDVYFSFTTKDAAWNVVAEASNDFVRSRSALNIDIVNHLLEHDQERGAEVVDFLVTEAGEDRYEFLLAFLNAPDSHGEKLVRLLATRPWSSVFDHLALSAAVSDGQTRADLVDAAFGAALYKTPDDFELGDAASAFIRDNYENLTTFKSELAPARIDVLMDFILYLGLIMNSLGALSVRLRQRIVSEGNYELTPANLRSALGLDSYAPIALDLVRENDDVWRRCREDIDGYLEAQKSDEHTPHAVLGADVLEAVAQEQREEWIDEKLAAVLWSSAPEAALSDIMRVDQGTWPAIVQARRMVLSAGNVLEYASRIGIDAELATFLKDQHELLDADQLEDYDGYRLALLMLNSPSIEPRMSVHFTQQLGVDRDSIVLADLEPGRNDLLAHMLKAELIDDDPEVFMHFIDKAGWPAVSEAFTVSKKISKFIAPNLVSGFVSDLLEGPQELDALKTIVVKNLDDYVSENDRGALRGAAAFARAEEIPLHPVQIERIAGAGASSEDVLWQLDQNKGLTADQLISVLTELGRDYSGFGEAPGHEFEIKTSNELGRIVKRLEKEYRVKAGAAKNGSRSVRIRA